VVVDEFTWDGVCSPMKGGRRNGKDSTVGNGRNVDAGVPEVALREDAGGGV